MTNDEQQKLFEHEQTAKPTGPVECFGKSFESDEARRAYFLEKLKEQLPELRKRPDFPVADDEDILRLSDPPYYTACPNPFLAEFVERYGRPYDATVPYHREPFAVDVSEGKTDQLYKAHGYHTKVPHLAIVPSILHYTKPGDIVLDGFCGSGMTGVAAQWCGNAPREYRNTIEERWSKEQRELPEWGSRKVILGDLSPAATFIAANYNFPFEVGPFAKAAQQIVKAVEMELGWMYETVHADSKTKGRINFTVWSEVFTCPECAGEIVFVTEALDSKGRVKKEFPCSHCSATLTKNALERCFETRFDPALEETWRRIRLEPVLVNYSIGKNRYEKPVDENDRLTLSKIEKLPYPSGVPRFAFPIEQMYHGSRLEPKGFSHVHRLYTTRAAHVLAALWRKAEQHEDPRIFRGLRAMVHHQFVNASVMNRYRPASSFGNAPLGGVYYVSSMIAEANALMLTRGTIKRFKRMAVPGWNPQPRKGVEAIVTTGSTTHLSELQDAHVDYVFTDPPFGENIFYADLNLMEEAWHGAITASREEAIVDKNKGKDLQDYQRLMQSCFQEYCRVLKPGRWITVVFHNSKNAVWNAIQEAMLAAGFVVADVRTLDKKQGSFRQITSTAVKQDLVISAYKPNHGLEERFKLKAGTEDGVWDFVRTHMRQLPVFVSKDGQAEVVAERQSYMLFDRMVAFHVQRGVTVPLSAGEFYAGLEQRFPPRDGMYFLTEQVAEYDRKRMTVKEVLQLELYVKDEESAIQWLKQQLTKKPQTSQEINPHFMKELGGWEKYERSLELAELLEQNFLRYDGTGDVPSQIHSYLSSNFKELRSLEKSDSALRAKAKDRWYVPDPRKAGDLEKLRDRALLKEFDEYRESAQKKLKVFRLEAVRAGFRRAWQDRDYATIIAVARKIPESVLQEDPKLLMWFDQALTRTGEDS